MSAEHAPLVPADSPRHSDEIAKRLLDRRATLKADAEYITDELERIDSQILELLDGQVGTHDLAGTKVQIREYSRTDKAAIERDYPATEYPQLYVMTLDTDAVNSQFSPAALDSYKVTGKKSVVIR